MLNDEFKERYTTIPLAVYKAFCDKGTKEIITHYHREIELIAVAEGSMEFYINSIRYYAKKGDVLIIPPYALHRGRTVENITSSYDCICFDAQLLCDESLKNSLESQAVSPVALVCAENILSTKLQSYIKRAFDACVSANLGWELEAIGNISLLFGVLKKNHLIFEDRATNNETLFGKKAMTYLANNISRSITSRDAARELYMSQSYFCRLFKKTFGCTFEQYVLTYRLEKARLYLKNTPMSITDIAFSLGFCSCSYFGKAFKNRFCQSPLAYRKSEIRK